MGGRLNNLPGPCVSSNMERRSPAASRLLTSVGELTLLALGLVLAVLVVVYRGPIPALLAVPVVAAGWITGIEFMTSARATPITVLLSGVVIAFATEFGVLWLARHRGELAGGADPAAAADAASGPVGPAIVASAAALTAGFVALALSLVPMVRDFGLWCAADLALATAAVLIMVPPAARGGPLGSVSSRTPPCPKRPWRRRVSVGSHNSGSCTLCTPNSQRLNPGHRREVEVSR